MSTNTTPAHTTITTFERILTAEGRYAPATIRGYISVAARFERWYAQHDADAHVLDANDDDIIDYLIELHDQGSSATSRRSIICALRAFYRCCGSPAADNPAAAIPLPRRPNVWPGPGYEMGELTRIMASARTTATTATGPSRHRAHRDAIIVELLCLYPVRAHEIVALQVSDVGDRELTVGSSGRRRTLPLSEATAARLDRYLADHRPHLGDGSQLLPTHSGHPAARVTRLLHRHGTAADVPGPHTSTRARRSLIHILVDGGVPIASVAYIAGISMQQLVITLSWARDRDVSDDLITMIDAWRAPDGPDATAAAAAA